MTENLQEKDLKKSIKYPYIPIIYIKIILLFISVALQ